jgi:hypothetical protein
MTEKEVTSILYQNINNAGRIEIKNVNEKNFYIFKSSSDEKYMVCVLDQTSDNLHSNVLETLEECYEWINLNQ